MLVDTVRKQDVGRRVPFSALISQYHGPGPEQDLVRNSQQDRVSALTKFHLVVVVLGSEKRMKAIK